MPTVGRTRGCTTAQVARELGVHKRTLLRWIEDGRLKDVKRVTFQGVYWRIWTAADIARARRLKETLKPGPAPKARRPSKS